MSLPTEVIAKLKQVMIDAGYTNVRVYAVSINTNPENIRLTVSKDCPNPWVPRVVNASIK